MVPDPGVKCVGCDGVITKRMHAICCDSCSGWQHRQCKNGVWSGISSAEYREMTKGNVDMPWECHSCGMPTMPPEISMIASPVTELNATYVVRTDEVMHSTTIESPQRLIDAEIEDRTFDITGRIFASIPAPSDDSLPDPVLEDDVPDELPLTFNVVEGGSKRGGQKLVSSHGFTYTKRNAAKWRIYWTCSVRNPQTKCQSSVKQFGDMFTPSIHPHVHPADPGALQKVTIAAKVKTLARHDVFRPAGDIVETVMKELTTEQDVCLPKPCFLTRAANLHRQNLRPKDPNTLEFEIDGDFLGPDFVKDDVRVNDQRHIVMATEAQLRQLKLAKMWFLDGTFKLVKKPFYQLMSIHVFVRKGDDVKQVPLVYILMSSRSKQDYVEVFSSILRLIGQSMVEWFMLDFESAAWQAIREVFPNSVVKGCVFYWAQRVYRKIQNKGLAPAYMLKGDKYLFLRKLMSLPEVVNYVQDTWIEGSMWRPLHWSVFRESVRTNNEVEGWHRRVNCRAGRTDLGFYLLVPLLRGEAETVDLQIRMVSAHLLAKIHRKKYKRLYGELQK